MRAARTDKGVSAVGQLVSLKMMVEPEGVVDRINAALPPALRVLGMRRVTNGFDARKLCDKRRYEYVLPAFAFDPTACRERQWYYEEAQAAAAAAAAQANGTQAAPAALPSGPSESATAMAMDGIAVETAAPEGLGAAASDDALSGSQSVAAAAAPATAASGSTPGAPATVPPAISPAEAPPGLQPEPAAAAAEVSASEPRADRPGTTPRPGSEADRGSGSFVFDEAAVTRMDAILRRYEGTHSFHNFTVKVAASAPEAKRYILSFRCTGTFELQVR